MLTKAKVDAKVTTGYHGKCSRPILTASSLLDPFLRAGTSEGRQPQDLADTGAVAADQKRQDYSTRHSA